MIRSKSISDYVEARLSDLKPGVPLPFEVYLYFAQNQHILTWKTKGDAPSDAELSKYRSRGIEKIWVHRDERAELERYLRPPASAPKSVPQPAPKAGPPAASAPAAAKEPPTSAPPPEASPKAPPKAEPTAPVPPVSAVGAPAAPESLPGPVIEEQAPLRSAHDSFRAEGESFRSTGTRTEEGALLAAVMKSSSLESQQKATVLAEAARAVLADSLQADSLAEQREANREARKIVKDFLDTISTQEEPMIAEIWQVVRGNDDLEHSVNVATYAVIFAMSIGTTDPDTISDIALAGLLHDLGLSQLPRALLTKPCKDLSGEELEQYSRHIEAGLRVIEAYASRVPEQVKAMIRRHHGKGLASARSDDPARILSLADLADEMSSGRWDGEKRTLRQTFETLRGKPELGAFSEQLNPELFSRVLEGVSGNQAEEIAIAASEAVEQARKIAVG